MIFGTQSSGVGVSEKHQIQQRFREGACLFASLIHVEAHLKDFLFWNLFRFTQISHGQMEELEILTF